MFAIQKIARQYDLSCKTCQLPAYETVTQQQDEHIANCGAYASGYDCMHLEDTPAYCKCGQVCETCGDRMELDDESDTWDCESCNFCIACEMPRALHGCTARADWRYSVGYDSSKCETRNTHWRGDECECVPESGALRSDVLTSIAHLQVLITAWQSQSLRDYTPESERDAVSVLTFLTHLINADGVPALTGGE